jgi:hypothetical protein
LQQKTPQIGTLSSRNNFKRMHNWLHLQVENVTTLPGTSTVVLSLGEDEAKHPIEMYLHKKYYRLLDEHVLVWRFAQLLVSSMV